MNRYSISRIVTVYRQWSLVERWLNKDSLFPANTEWIFVNDCAEDPPGENVQQSLHKRGVTLLTPQRNLGLAGARNLGWSRSTGDWLDFVDGDDLPMPLNIDDLDLDADLIFFPTAAHFDDTQFNEHLRCEDRMSAQFFPVESDVFVYPPEMARDVKMAAILWRRTAIVLLEGLDGRYDMVEDNDIVWRAGAVGLRAKEVAFCKQSYCFIPNADRLQLYRIFNKWRVYRRIFQECDTAHRARVAQRNNELMRSIFWSVVEHLKEGTANRTFLFKEGVKAVIASLRAASR